MEVRETSPLIERFTYTLAHELHRLSIMRYSVWNMELTVANLHEVSYGVQGSLLVCNRAGDQ